MTPSDSPPPSARSRLEGLIARARAADGNPPFSDGALVELERGERQLVWLEDSAALATATSAEFVVDPDARGRGIGTRMLELLLARGGGPMLFWAHGNHPGAQALAARQGLEPVRELLHLAAPVPPRPAEVPARRAEDADRGHAVRPFLVTDADAWVALNARAFAEHPEQGAVTRADLDTIMSEGWFDPEDFLVLEEHGALVGYAWLKVEGEAGEFYVVGVDPERQGSGIGRALMDAGMTRLAERGIRSAHLYVEGDNAPALALYASFGFTRRSIDVQYRAFASVGTGGRGPRGAAGGAGAGTVR